MIKYKNTEQIQTTNKQQSKVMKQHTHSTPSLPDTRYCVLCLSTWGPSSSLSPLHTPSPDIKQPWPKINNVQTTTKKLKTKHPAPRPFSHVEPQCVCLTKCELFLKERAMREAEHLLSLSPWYSKWSSLTPHPLSNWVMVGGWGRGWVCVCMCWMRRRWWGFNSPWRGSLTDRQW